MGKKEIIEEVLAEHPLLSDYGYGWALMDRQELQPKLEEFRKDLLREISIEKIFELSNWMGRNLKMRRTINKKFCSYSLKHRLQEQIGYVTNGQFITAALLAGFKIDPSRPNPCLNIIDPKITIKQF